MKYDLDALIWEMNEANRKATEASDAYNKEVKRITDRETKPGIDKVVLNTIIRDIKDKSIKLKDLAGKQSFYSSEVVRISALLQGIVAYDDLTKRGFHRRGL